MEVMTNIEFGVHMYFF